MGIRVIFIVYAYRFYGIGIQCRYMWVWHPG